MPGERTRTAHSPEVLQCLLRSFPSFLLMFLQIVFCWFLTYWDNFASPVFQMVRRSCMAADSWKMKWMTGLSSSVPILSRPGAFRVFILLNFNDVVLFNFDW